MSRARMLRPSLILCLLAVPAAVEAGATVIRIGSAEFSGGTVVAASALELPGTAEVRRVEGPRGAPGATVRATFQLGRIPAGLAGLWMKGRAVHGGEPPAIEIVLNGRRVGRAASPFAREWWEYRRFAIPAGVLRRGSNQLEIRCFNAGVPGRAGRALLVAECVIASAAYVPVHELTTAYTVDLSAAPSAAAEREHALGRVRGFRIRGTKGWAWTPEQYLSEIPWLSRFGINFLMNGYTSMFTDAVRRINRWWEPIPGEKKRAFEEIARQCRLNGIEFCFAFHPQLYSERPLRLDDEADFEALWLQYEWMQQAGVTAFSLCFDDVPTRGLDMPALAAGQARLANRLLERLKQRGPSARLIFCPVTYYGCGDKPAVRPYLEALGNVLSQDILVFWTGDDSVTPRITRSCGETFTSIVRHRLFIWDNYPTNDRAPILHLGPVTGRDADLTAVADGYLSNPHAPQHDINRLPLATSADYASDPAAYDPQRSIARAIRMVARTPAQRDVLARLVELYPGELVYGQCHSEIP
jgi:hypothetical protein